MSLPRRTPLVWNAWRQHRLALVGLVGVFSVNAIALVVTGLKAHAHTPGMLIDCGTGSNLICFPLSNLLANATDILGFLPPVVAMFVGAPLAAREFETGSYRFSGTQAVGPAAS